METQGRVRRRSIAVQLQIALDDAAKAMTADISVQKLAQTRLDCLLKMQARERNDKLRKLSDELKAVRAENEKLRQELAAALAAKTTTRPMTDIERVIAQYESEKVSSAPHGSATQKQQEEQ